MTHFPPPVVRFCQSFTMCQTFFDEIQKESISIFELKTSKMSFFGKSCFQKFTWLILFRQMDLLCLLCAFLKAILWKKNSGHWVRIVTEKSQRVRFWIKSFTTCQIMNWKLPNLSDVDLKILPRVMLWIKTIKTFQALKWNLYNVSKLGWKVLPRVKVWSGNFTTCQA